MNAFNAGMNQRFVLQRNTLVKPWQFAKSILKLPEKLHQQCIGFLQNLR